MTDNDADRIVRMLRVSESDPLQMEAADEIERLRADLKLAAFAEHEYVRTIDEDNERLRAELAAEREHHDDALEMNNLLQQDKAELRAQVTKLREALEPFDQLGQSPTIITPEMLRHARAVLEETK